MKFNQNIVNIGLLGENLAVGYLLKNKYLILFRNKKEGFDEIDIVAVRQDKTLVFFEVKSRMGLRGGDEVFLPEDNFSNKKKRRVARACMHFVVEHPDLVDGDEGWQIDLLAIRIEPGLKRFNLRHYRNV